MDKLILKSCKFYGYHGSAENERLFGQSFVVDVELYLDTRLAGETDLLSNAVDYGRVYDIIEDYVENESFSLIESLAENISSKVLSEFDIVNGILVRIKKTQAKIIGKYDYVAIEIERFRE